MSAREIRPELEHAPYSPIALFDEAGKLHGWSPAFADTRALTPPELRGCRIDDFWGEIDAARWSGIWQAIQNGSAPLVLQVEEPARRGADELVELEIGRFVCEGMSLAKVETRRAPSLRLHLLQQEILQAMAYGLPLRDLMDMLCRRVESLAPSVTCSILAVDRQLRLRHLASPSLPEHYARAIDGTPAGPKCGSCGTAVSRGEPVEVTDIATDPLWEDYRHLALPLGLRACWSSPIKSADGRVIGVFAFYYPRSRGPTPLERQIVATCLHLSMIALEYEETRARAYEYAFTDPLTHLPNRARFQQRVSECLAIGAETRQRVAVHYIGLDRFRGVNELLGYAAGDELLQDVAQRLTSLVKDRDAVARIGGDEFALVHIGNLRDEQIADRARKLIELLEMPFKSSCGYSVPLGASVGIAVGPGEASDADDLIHDAALAMRRVKEMGRGAYFFYEKDLNERMQARRQAEADLRSALANDEHELYFQPVIDLSSGAVERVEALLRWHHPERGMVMPSEFIPLAEQTGLIEQLGAWALREACRAAKKLPPSVAVAVNLSPLQFERPGLVETVAHALEDAGIPPERLELEITESVLLCDSPVNSAVLDQLGDLGVGLALDDFGTGYSSLSYLHRFSVDRVKIDHSFVREIACNEGALKIVRAIVMLAHSLGIKVTAEGVETDEQLAAVRGEGCDSVQGYYTGAPQPLEDLLHRLQHAAGARVSAA